MQPRYGDSIDFLKQWNPNGPWVLTGIGIDQKKVVSKSFRPGEEPAIHSWLDQFGRDHNIYFHVNPCKEGTSGKALKEDVTHLAWLHVDIDPRVGEDIKAEQDRAMRLLKNPPDGLPPATVIVFSGGGYQGFWCLAEPMALPDAAARRLAERYNQQLEILLGADHCHNVDRIMRLPGTINRPDKKKRAKGRKEALATLIEFNDTRFDLKTFTPAAETQKDKAGFSGSQVQVSTNVRRLASVDELPDGVKDLVKVVIVQGHDPDNPKKFPSRSECLFWVICELVRAELDDDTIFSIITDKDFGISASVLDKGRNADRYAIRQIERAREEAIAPELRELNEKHAVISSIGGRCRIVTEEMDYSLKRPRLVQQSFDDFRNRYLNRKIDMGPNPKTGIPMQIPLGNWWLTHPNRRQYDTIVFAPGQEIPNVYNLWRGFACESKPGDCGLFLEHVRKNLCREDESLYEYLISWIARAVQHPDKPGYSAVVLRGRQGTGKSFFATVVGSLFGRHFMHASDPKHLVGNFNAHLRDCVILFGDEAFYAGDKKHESVLKTLVTEETIVVEQKGVDAEIAANCVHLILASDSDWVIPTNLDDRRFLVLDVSSDHMRDDAYFRAIRAQLDAGGREGLLHLLMTRDLSQFNVREVPKTKALQQQKLFSMDAEHEWWYNRLQEGRLLPGHGDWKTEVLTYDLRNDFIVHTSRFGGGRRLSSTKFGQFLKKAVPNIKSVQRAGQVEVIWPNGKTEMVQRPYFYVLPSLEECRRHWDERFGGPYDWSKPEMVDGDPVGLEKDPF